MLSIKTSLADAEPRSRRNLNRTFARYVKIEEEWFCIFITILKIIELCQIILGGDKKEDKLAQLSI